MDVMTFCHDTCFFCSWTVPLVVQRMIPLNQKCAALWDQTQSKNHLQLKCPVMKIVNGQTWI